MNRELKLTFLSALWLVCLVWLVPLQAASFKLGETVFVAFPNPNIKDDAFIIGKVSRVTDKGDIQVAVLDYVEGHDYGSSCVPISKNAQQDQGLGAGWELWSDTTKLDTKLLEYVVPKDKVMKLDSGRLYFVERNNVYIVFGRWKSDAPMLTLERMDRAIREAKTAGLDAMQPAFELAKLHRQSFYGDFGRPLMAFESIAPLNTALGEAMAIMQAQPTLAKLWRDKPRNWEVIGQSTHDYFMVEAIDKLVEDAQNQLYEDGLESADANVLAEMKARLQQLKR